MTASRPADTGRNPAAPVTRHPYEVAHERLAMHLNGVVSRGRLQAIAEQVVDAIEAEARAAAHREVDPLDVETALRAIDAMKASAGRNVPVGPWISVAVVRSILEGRHPILARLSSAPTEPAE